MHINCLFYAFRSVIFGFGIAHFFLTFNQSNLRVQQKDASTKVHGVEKYQASPLKIKISEEKHGTVSLKSQKNILTKGTFRFLVRLKAKEGCTGVGRYTEV